MKSDQCPRCRHIRDEVGPFRVSAQRAWGALYEIESVVRVPGLGLQATIDHIKGILFRAIHTPDRDPAVSGE